VLKHYQDSQDSSSDVTILGIGNLLMGDEGVGIHVIDSIYSTYSFSPAINFIDGGTIGIDLIPYFEECKKMMIIDAVDSQEEPGYIVTLENDAIHYRFNTKLSLHHAGLSDVLSIIKLQEIDAPDMILIGIQPQIVEMGLELSATVGDKMPQIINIITNKLTEWGIECKKISSQ
jgi:hydrogenase maturation protease